MSCMLKFRLYFLPLYSSWFSFSAITLCYTMGSKDGKADYNKIKQCNHNKELRVGYLPAILLKRIYSSKGIPRSVHVLNVLDTIKRPSMPFISTYFFLETSYLAKITIRIKDSSCLCWDWKDKIFSHICIGLVFICSIAQVEPFMTF